MSPQSMHSREFSMDWANEVEKELQIETNLTLGRMHKKDMFYALETSLQEMKELQKRNPKAEDTPFIEPREREEVETEESGTCEDTKKERQEKIKTYWLIQLGFINC